MPLGLNWGHREVHVLLVAGHPGVEGRRCKRLVLVLHAVLLFDHLLLRHYLPLFRGWTGPSF